MDSITQATLGAAVGHLCWHKEGGRKALAVGALLGTLPDLDVILYPLLDRVQQLYWHRGESHSLLFIFVGSIGLGLILRKYGLLKNITTQKAIIGVFLILSTHVIIDLFTVYGTQLLAPFSRRGYAVSNMFIIDPLFSIPLLVATIGAYHFNNKSIAVSMNHAGLFIAAVYAVWSLSAQAIADHKFRSALSVLDVEVSRQLTSAAPFNTLLWRHIAETPDGFVLGYWSWLDGKEQEIDFQYIPKNAEIVKDISTTRAFNAIEWFSKGWWFAVKTGKTEATVVDLRFTEIPSAPAQPYTQWHWPFAWEFQVDAPGDPQLKSVRPQIEDPINTLKLLGYRIKGQGGWLTPEEKNDHYLSSVVLPQSP